MGFFLYVKSSLQLCPRRLVGFWVLFSLFFFGKKLCFLRFGLAGKVFVLCFVVGLFGTLLVCFLEVNKIWSLQLMGLI